MADYHIPTPEEQAQDDRRRALYAEAEAAAERGDLDTAVELARQALAAVPAYDVFGMRYLEGRLGDLLIRADRADEARRVLEASVAAGSDIPATEGMLHQLYAATDDYEAIARVVRSQMADVAASQGPYFQGARLVLGLAGRSASLATGGVIDTAPLDLAEVLATESGNRELLFAVQHERGRVAEGAGDIEQAIAVYRRQIEAGSRFQETVARLISLLEGQTRFEDAVAVARELLDQPLDDGLKDYLERRIVRLAKRKPPTERRAIRAPLDASAFGREALALEPEQFLSLEAERGLGDSFAPIDRLAARLLSLRLSGNKIGEAAWQDKSARLEVSPDERALLEARFSRISIESRGAWFLPEAISVALRVLSPREEYGSVRSDTPDAIFTWAVLDPIFDALHRPLELREKMVGKAAPQQRAAWQGVADLFESLGIDARLELDAMSYGGGWSKLHAAERALVQERLAATLVEWAPAATRRYRAIRLRELIESYYEKADANGQALRTRVISAGLQAPMVAYFRGDWLEFLRYIGESPHPNDQVTTALPETTVQVAGQGRLAAAAAAIGVSAEQAALIGQSLWGAGESPIEARVHALTAYWQAFDAIHAQQDHGMPSLWGLVVESRAEVFHVGGSGGAGDFNRGQYTTLPAELKASVERLWGGEFVPDSPDLIVSAASPHHLMAETFGVALKFWQSLALTAWFVCEGPYSRTSIEDAEAYFGRNLEALSQVGTPVDPTLFRELTAAKKTLKQLPPEERSRQSVDVGGGISFDLVISMGPGRLAGFDRLRDVITRHRRTWAAAHLASYLAKRSEEEIRAAGTSFHRMLAEKNKPPAPKVFGKKVRGTVDHWFGGDLGALYTAIGEKRPFETRRAQQAVPDDRPAFVQRFAAAIRSDLRTDLPARDADDAARTADLAISGLAQAAVRCLQMTEQLGRRPSLDEMGRPGFESAERVSVNENGRYYQELILGPDTDVAFARFQAAVDLALLKHHPSPAQAALPVARKAVEQPVAHEAPSQPIAPETNEPLPRETQTPPGKKGFLGRFLGRNQ
jgi:tetratricopeptide (TPR) repeat protein